MHPREMGLRLHLKMLFCFFAFINLRRHRTKSRTFLRFILSKVITLSLQSRFERPAGADREISLI